MVAEMNVALALGGLGGSVTTETIFGSCFYYADPTRTLDAASWTFIGLVALLTAEVIVATLLHWRADAKGETLHVALGAFSLRSNLQQLLAMPSRPTPGTLSCLHGLRALSMAWIILGHRYETFLGVGPVSNSFDILDLTRHWSNMPLVNAYISVDTFFLLSGLLTTYVICNDQRRGRAFSLFQFYVYRYIRLTVPLAMHVMYLGMGSQHIGHGPMWYHAITYHAEQCRKTWWTTLLYVNNWVDQGANSWYLMVDMQLSWLAPLVLLPLLRWPKPALGLIAALTLAAMAATFANTYIFELFWSFPAIPIPKPTSVWDAWKYVYINTPLRAVPYLCGMAMGYLLSQQQGTADKKWPKLAHWQVALGWACSAACCLAVQYLVAIAYQESYQYSRLDAAFYAGLHRLAWSAGIGWVIFACVWGYGGPVESILSWRYFVPLSKLTYCVYLTHLTFIHMEVATLRNPAHLDHFGMVHGWLGDMIVVLPISAALYLGVEAPTLVLLRAVFHKGASAAPAAKAAAAVADKVAEPHNDASRAK